MSRARSRVMRLAAAGSIACIAVAAAVIVLSDGHTPRKQFFCADIGLHGPAADTPGAALAAYVEKRGGRAANWRRIGHSTTKPDHASGIAPYESYSYTPQRAGIRPTLSRISVSNRLGTWSAAGACA